MINSVISFSFNLKTGQTIKMGEKLGCVSENNSNNN